MKVFLPDLWFILSFLAAFVMWWGVFGVIYNRQDLISVLIHGELALAGVFLLTCVAYLQTGNPACLSFALIVLTVAACETAIGLSLIVAFYRLRGKIRLEDLTLILPLRSDKQY